MCSKSNQTPKSTGNTTPQFSTGSGVSSALSYTPPIYRETKGCVFIEFYAYDPEQAKMRRKRIKLNHIKGNKTRKEYARGVILRLNEQLKHGWNPWIAKDTSNLITFEEATARYMTHVEKMLANGYFRKETYSGYKSYVKMMKVFIKETLRPIYYCYQFDHQFCVDFLDWVFVERNNGAQTRNNYLNFLRVFSGFLVEKGMLKNKPTDGIRPINKRYYKKERLKSKSRCIC